MKNNRLNLYLSLGWLLSLGIAYGMGWWSGIKNMTHVAAGAADTGMWIVLAVIAVVAVGASVAAFRMRGLMDGRGQQATRV